MITVVGANQIAEGYLLLNEGGRKFKMFMKTMD